MTLKLFVNDAHME